MTKLMTSIHPQTPCFNHLNCLKYIIVQYLGSGWSRDSVVGVTTTLWNGHTGVWIPVGARNFLFSRNVQTKSRAHPVSRAMDTAVLYRVYSDYSLPSSAKFKNEWSYTSTPPVRFYIMDRGNFTFR